MTGELTIKDKKYDRPNCIQVPFVDFPVDASAAAVLRPFPGVVVVEMAPYQGKSAGGLYIPEDLQRQNRADVGVVVAVGEDRTEDGKPQRILTGSGFYENALPLDVYPGDRVLLDPYRGDSFETFHAGGYRPSGVVRIYGDASVDYRQPRFRQIDEFIMAVVTKTKLLPRGRLVLFKRDPVKTTTDSGVHLPDREQVRNPLGVIIEASPLAEKHGRKPGMRCMYKQTCSHPLKIYDIEFAAGTLPLEGNPDDYCFIPYENLTVAL